ncbi:MULTISPECIES: MacB family efflux pump subunit [unclassified Campylobacter]|uniref:MacB family efflux pump subunit n=1 Tax=unclassified Campylobacter TaxID=2593542 RepID=UPI0022E9EA34|nr:MULTISPECIES: MacB family efflux pump subunit [unclassified Campylobacter]MDA3080266.1 MacB family efflux pump subunit [Campylobacter sp. CS_NA2]MDA3081868.1 MacB family efflux pump subunit [Campylobacter sp. CS_NA1]MDA3086323.1 MacB family efflux pump subunit [Campylobacter sp. CS_ED1]MDA3089595.1 MacB family efflux pump subunit [Campylobacter sp. CS_ED2]WBR51833.1 MacB family efflux pump subunit [Campylobacter sp. CS_NA3]
MIKLENINKIFTLGENKVHVLKDINLHIKKGEFISIIGQSGSGKSTLMNIIGCLDTPSSGSYFIGGKDVAKFSSDDLANLRSKKFGFVFQRYNLIATMSAAENVALPAIYAGMGADERNKRAKELLGGLELGDKTASYPNKLSGGQQQRVSIARALMNGGEIILADEPTGALDSKSGETVMQILCDLHKQGHTIIIVTHDKNIAEYADRIIEIKDGEILSDRKKSENIYELKKEKVGEKNALFAYKDQFLESFKMSVSAIFSHKLRSMLTMLGIIIGIASVICVVALGNGSQEKILASIKSIGTNTITVQAGRSFGDMRAGFVSTLTISDSNALARQPYIDYSTPNVNSSGTLTYANFNSRTEVRGGGEHSLSVSGIEIESGRNFSAEDIESSASVVVIDQNTKKQFFKNENPLSKTITFAGKPLRIIGVAADEKNAFGVSESLRIYVPYSTLINKISGNRRINSITVKVKDDVDPQMAEESITQLLMQRHGTRDFHTRNSDTIKQTVESTTGTMKILISSIAVISLIVGGIGVMNIMLVSVTERTKEIGIAMAIGAKESNILQQFLIEAILLCSLGGFIGILFALALGYGFNSISSDFTMKFTTAPFIIAFVVSSAIGIIFGYLPARNASKLNPIDALAQE